MLRVSFLSRAVIRGLSAAQPAAAAQSEKVDKESLMKLRRKTGYSYVNCRKALLQFGTDLSAAEKWLRQNAEKEGWAKAAKLSNRQTTQGLVAVKTAGKVAAVVELSCETDFVARGEPFKQLLSLLVTATLEHAKSGNHLQADTISTKTFDVDTVKTSDGKSLKEVIAMAVGKLGENISAKRIDAFYAPKEAVIYGGSHPKEGSEDVPMGRFVSLVAMSRKKSEEQFPTERLADQICQHIIGMRSETLGTSAEPKETKKQVQTTNDGQDELNEFFQGQTTQIDADETQLLRQSFMLNPSQTVFEYVSGHNASIKDFVRFELGGESSD